MDKYEKLYNEALERFKSFKEKYYTKDTNLGDVIFDKNGEMQKDFNGIFPELCESEDERIRKFLINLVSTMNWRVDWPEEKVKEEKVKCLAYLEKQKEQKPASTEDMPYITDEHFFEREPVDSFRYKLAKYMTQNSRKEESPDGYTYHISAETILEMAKEELLKRGVVQKPVEWSEEDEMMLNSIIATCELAEQDRHSGPAEHLLETQRIWLKSLRPQPKQEWDDDDYVCFSEIVSLIGQHYRGENIERGNELINWLKGYEPQPSWKPSEQEKSALRTAIYDERHSPKVAAQLQNILKAFEGKESRKDWKPSEEQIQALEYAVSSIPPNYLKEQEYMMTLIGQVIQQLKKLM